MVAMTGYEIVCGATELPATNIMSSKGGRVAESVVLQLI
jgi:hypothetical protein